MDQKSIEIRSFADRTRCKQHTGEFSRVQQHLAPETDINNIMSKYEKTGVIQHLNRYGGQYGDFGDIPQYQEGLNRVMAAEEMFMSLPSKIRDRFHNDPGNFIAFATDGDNLEEMRKMGLAPPAPLKEPVEERPSLGAKGDDKAAKQPKKPDPEPGDQ